MAEANKSGIFAKAQKRISRTKTKVLQTLGKADKYTDETFDDLVQKTEKQHEVAHHLQKEIKNYVHCMRALSNANKSLVAALSHTYEEEWTDEIGFKKLLETQDLLFTDYLDSVQSTVIEPMNTYLASFAPLKVRTAKRGRKMVDFDNARHNLEVLQAAKKKDEAKINKAQEELNESRQIFEELHSELCTDLPNFYNNRVTFYADLFQKFYNRENTLHTELARTSQGLSETSEKLSKDHVQFVYTPKRPLSKSLSDNSDEHPVNGESSPRGGADSPASGASPAATPTAPIANPRTTVPLVTPSDPDSGVASAAGSAVADGAVGGGGGGGAGVEDGDAHVTDHVYGNQDSVLAEAKVNGDAEVKKSLQQAEDTTISTFTAGDAFAGEGCHGDHPAFLAESLFVRPSASASVTAPVISQPDNCDDPSAPPIYLTPVPLTTSVPPSSSPLPPVALPLPSAQLEQSVTFNTDEKGLKEGCSAISEPLNMVGHGLKEVSDTVPVPLASGEKESKGVCEISPNKEEPTVMTLLQVAGYTQVQTKEVKKTEEEGQKPKTAPLENIFSGTGRALSVECDSPLENNFSDLGTAPSADYEENTPPGNTFPELGRAPLAQHEENDLLESNISEFGKAPNAEYKEDTPLENNAFSELRRAPLAQREENNPLESNFSEFGRAPFAEYKENAPLESKFSALGRAPSDECKVFIDNSYQQEIDSALKEDREHSQELDITKPHSVVPNCPAETEKFDEAVLVEERKSETTQHEVDAGLHDSTSAVVVERVASLQSRSSPTSISDFDSLVEMLERKSQDIAKHVDQGEDGVSPSNQNGCVFETVANQDMQVVICEKSEGAASELTETAGQAVSMASSEFLITSSFSDVSSSFQNYQSPLGEVYENIIFSSQEDLLNQGAKDTTNNTELGNRCEKDGDCGDNAAGSALPEKCEDDALGSVSDEKCKENVTGSVSGEECRETIEGCMLAEERSVITALDQVIMSAVCPDAALQTDAVVIDNELTQAEEPSPILKTFQAQVYPPSFLYDSFPCQDSASQDEGLYENVERVDFNLVVRKEPTVRKNLSQCKLDGSAETLENGTRPGSGYNPPDEQLSQTCLDPTEKRKDVDSSLKNSGATDTNAQQYCTSTQPTDHIRLPTPPRDPVTGVMLKPPVFLVSPYSLVPGQGHGEKSLPENNVGLDEESRKGFSHKGLEMFKSMLHISSKAKNAGQKSGAKSTKRVDFDSPEKRDSRSDDTKKRKRSSPEKSPNIDTKSAKKKMSPASPVGSPVCDESERKTTTKQPEQKNRNGCEVNADLKTCKLADMSFQHGETPSDPKEFRSSTARDVPLGPQITGDTYFKSGRESSSSAGDQPSGQATGDATGNQRDAGQLQASLSVHAQFVLDNKGITQNLKESGVMEPPALSESDHVRQNISPRSLPPGSSPGFKSSGQSLNPLAPPFMMPASATAPKSPNHSLTASASDFHSTSSSSTVFKPMWPHTQVDTHEKMSSPREDLQQNWKSKPYPMQTAKSDSLKDGSLPVPRYLIGGSSESRSSYFLSAIRHAFYGRHSQTSLPPGPSERFPRAHFPQHRSHSSRTPGVYLRTPYRRLQTDTDHWGVEHGGDVAMGTQPSLQGALQPGLMKENLERREMSPKTGIDMGTHINKMSKFGEGDVVKQLLTPSSVKDSTVKTVEIHKPSLGTKSRDGHKVGFGTYHPTVSSTPKANAASCDLDMAREAWRTAWRTSSVAEKNSADSISAGEKVGDSGQLSSPGTQSTPQAGICETTVSTAKNGRGVRPAEGSKDHHYINVPQPRTRTIFLKPCEDSKPKAEAEEDIYVKMQACSSNSDKTPMNKNPGYEDMQQLWTALSLLRSAASTPVSKVCESSQSVDGSDQEMKTEESEGNASDEGTVLFGEPGMTGCLKEGPTPNSGEAGVKDDLVLHHCDSKVLQEESQGEGDTEHGTAERGCQIDIKTISASSEDELGAELTGKVKEMSAGILEENMSGDHSESSQHDHTSASDKMMDKQLQCTETDIETEDSAANGFMVLLESDDKSSVTGKWQDRSPTSMASGQDPFSSEASDGKPVVCRQSDKKSSVSVKSDDNSHRHGTSSDKSAESDCNISVTVELEDKLLVTKESHDKSPASFESDNASLMSAASNRLSVPITSLDNLPVTVKPDRLHSIREVDKPPSMMETDCVTDCEKEKSQVIAISAVCSDTESGKEKMDDGLCMGDSHQVQSLSKCTNMFTGLTETTATFTALGSIEEVGQLQTSTGTKETPSGVTGLQRITEEEDTLQAAVEGHLQETRNDTDSFKEEQDTNDAVNPDDLVPLAGEHPHISQHTAPLEIALLPPGVGENLDKLTPQDSQSVSSQLALPSMLSSGISPGEVHLHMEVSKKATQFHGESDHVSDVFETLGENREIKRGLVSDGVETLTESGGLQTLKECKEAESYKVSDDTDMGSKEAAKSSSLTDLCQPERGDLMWSQPGCEDLELKETVTQSTLSMCSMGTNSTSFSNTDSCSDNQANVRLSPRKDDSEGALDYTRHNGMATPASSDQQSRSPSTSESGRISAMMESVSTDVILCDSGISAQWESHDVSSTDMSVSVNANTSSEVVTVCDSGISTGVSEVAQSVSDVMSHVNPASSISDTVYTTESTSGDLTNLQSDHDQYNSLHHQHAPLRDEHATGGHGDWNVEDNLSKKSENQTYADKQYLESVAKTSGAAEHESSELTEMEQKSLTNCQEMESGPRKKDTQNGDKMKPLKTEQRIGLFPVSSHPQNDLCSYLTDKNIMTEPVGTDTVEEFFSVDVSVEHDVCASQTLAPDLPRTFGPNVHTEQQYDNAVQKEEINESKLARGDGTEEVPKHSDAGTSTRKLVEELDSSLQDMDKTFVVSVQDSDQENIDFIQHQQVSFPCGDDISTADTFIEKEMSDIGGHKNDSVSENRVHFQFLNSSHGAECKVSSKLERLDENGAKNKVKSSAEENVEQVDDLIELNTGVVEKDDSGMVDAVLEEVSQEYDKHEIHTGLMKTGIDRLTTAKSKDNKGTRVQDVPMKEGDNLDIVLEELVLEEKKETTSTGLEQELHDRGDKHIVNTAMAEAGTAENMVNAHTETEEDLDTERSQDSMNTETEPDLMVEGKENTSICLTPLLSEIVSQQMNTEVEGGQTGIVEKIHSGKNADSAESEVENMDTEKNKCKLKTTLKTKAEEEENSDSADTRTKPEHCMKDEKPMTTADDDFDDVDILNMVKEGAPGHKDISKEGAPGHKDNLIQEELNGIHELNMTEQEEQDDKQTVHMAAEGELDNEEGMSTVGKEDQGQGGYESGEGSEGFEVSGLQEDEEGGTDDRVVPSDTWALMELGLTCDQQTAQPPQPAPMDTPNGPESPGAEAGDNVYEAPPKGDEDSDDEEDSAVYQTPPSNKPVYEPPPTTLYQVEATHTYAGEDIDELSFEPGDIIYVVPFDNEEEQDDGWQMGILQKDGLKGVFPENFTKHLSP